MDKLDWLEKYAKKAGLEIDYEATERMKMALSDETITIRVPSELKKELKKKAKNLKLPYQRLIKNYLIEGLKKDLR